MMSVYDVFGANVGLIVGADHGERYGGYECRYEWVERLSDGRYVEMVLMNNCVMVKLVIRDTIKSSHDFGGFTVTSRTYTEGSGYNRDGIVKQMSVNLGDYELRDRLDDEAIAAIRALISHLKESIIS